MTRLSRNLLVFAMLFWVAPLSAQQAGTAPEQWSSDACPNERARPIVISADGRLGEVPVSDAARSAFLP